MNELKTIPQFSLLEVSLLNIRTSSDIVASTGRFRGPIVYRLGHELFKLRSGVRLPVGSQGRKSKLLCFFYLVTDGAMFSLLTKQASRGRGNPIAMAIGLSVTIQDDEAKSPFPSMS